MSKENNVPNKVREAIVEVRYETTYPFEIMIGILYEKLVTLGLKYSCVPMSNLKSTNPLEISYPYLPTFYNDTFKIELLPNSIIINWKEEPNAWVKYKEFLMNVIRLVFDNQTIVSVNRIGFRCIVEYIDWDLRDELKFKFTFGMPEIKSDTISFRSTFKLEDTLVNLNLVYCVELMDKKQGNFASYIDIDTIRENLNLLTIREIDENIENMHSKEKHLYDGLLKLNS